MTVKNLNIFRGRRVFITGHTGFKGSWLAFLMHEIGAEVMGYALPPETSVNHFDLLNLSNKINHIKGDIKESNNLLKILKDFQPEFVFHLAAQSLVRESYENPLETFKTNIFGSINLLDSVRQTKSIRSLVYITSDKCYENVEWIWGYRENDRLGGRDPYSASKASAEIVFSSYLRSFFDYTNSLGAATARAGNVIGGGDWATDRIIPDCIRSIEKGHPIILRNPKATRPWQHVLEPLSGYILLAKNLYDHPKKFSGSWNFGPSTNYVQTVLQIVESIFNQIGKGSIQISESTKEAYEANLLQLNCDKSHQLLNWYPRWNIDKTLNAIVVWYKAYMNNENIEDITRNQIYDYFPELK
jgi:CDP-glucose 4,6-dehydratase